MYKEGLIIESIFSKEYRKNMSRIMKGKFVGEKHPMYGKKHTLETIEKMKETRKNQGLDEKYCRKQREAHSGTKNHFYGKKHTEEAKLKISKKRTGKCLADKNPAWNGGTTFLPYCYKFNEELKEAVRKRDNFQCQNPCCKLTQEEHFILYNRKLIIHHVHYDKHNCEPDLISLCLRCNVLANTDRNFHEQFYMNILNKIELLFDKI